MEGFENTNERLLNGEYLKRGGPAQRHSELFHMRAHLKLSGLRRRPFVHSSPYTCPNEVGGTAEWHGVQVAVPVSG